MKFIGDDEKKTVNWHSKKEFYDVKSNASELFDFDVNTPKNIEVEFNTPNYPGFKTLELSKQFMYETYYDLMQPFFDHNLEKNLQLL